MSVDENMKPRFIKEEAGIFFDCRSCDQKRVRCQSHDRGGTLTCPLCGKKNKDYNTAYSVYRVRDTHTGKVIAEAKRNTLPTLRQKRAFSLLTTALEECARENLSLFFKDGALIGVNGEEVKSLYRGKDFTPYGDKEAYSPVVDMGEVCITQTPILTITGGHGPDLLAEYHE